jgi:hypothetical protein
MLLCQNLLIEGVNPAEPKKYLSSLVKTLDKGLLQINKSLIKIGYKNRIEKYLFFFGSPWTVSQSKIVRITKDKPFVIDSDFLKKIILKEEDQVIKNIESERSTRNWHVLEEKVTLTKLNGYKVNKIFQRKTKEAEIHLFVSYAPLEIQDKIYSYINTKKAKGSHESHSSMLASFSVLRDIFPNKNDFLYIDIGKNITDVYIVKEDAIAGISSFPIGESTIINKMSSTGKMSHEIITSMINTRCSGKCEPSVSIKLDKLLEKGFDSWVKSLNDAVSKISSESDTPKNILIIPDNEIVSIFIERMKQKNPTVNIKLLDSNPEITAVGESVFNNFVSKAKAFRKEPFVKMDIIYLDKLVKQKSLYA